MKTARPRKRLPGSPVAVLYGAAGSLAVKIVRLLLRLPRHRLIGLLRFVRSVAGYFQTGTPAIDPIGEIIDVLENDPKGEEAVRRIIGEGRDDQLKSFLAGVFRHQLGSGPKWKSASAVTRWNARNAASPSMTVGIIGDQDDAAPLIRAYESLGSRLIHHQKPTAEEFNATIRSADGLDILSYPFSDDELLEEALEAGKPVSLHLSCVKSELAWRDLYKKSRRTGTPLRLLYPYLFYPPARLVRRLLDDGEIGEPATIRIRATVGATGGVRTPVLPSGDQYLDHPAFDHFLLATFYGGPISKTAAYLNPMQKRTGGQGLVNFQYSAPGRFGLLECTSAPDMFIWSDHHPYDLDAEIAGTDGIIWLRRGMAKRTQAAPVYMRSGKTGRTFGIESGFSEVWNAVYHQTAEHFLEILRGRNEILLTEEEIVTALESRQAAYESNKVKRSVFR